MVLSVSVGASLKIGILRADGAVLPGQANPRSRCERVGRCRSRSLTAMKI